MSRTERIIELTSNKNKQFALTLNYELVKLFKAACKKNGTSMTKTIEALIINYIDKNGLLED